jgi:signal transduction histidine kinase
MLSMEERAGAIGGVLRIDSAPGRGTHVVVEVVLA